MKQDCWWTYFSRSFMIGLEADHDGNEKNILQNFQNLHFMFNLLESHQACIPCHTDSFALIWIKIKAFRESYLLVRDMITAEFSSKFWK